MEDVFWKFPHLGEQIIKKLSNKNLAKAKMLGPCPLSQGPKPCKMQGVGPLAPFPRLKNRIKCGVLGPLASVPRPKNLVKYKPPPQAQNPMKCKVLCPWPLSEGSNTM